jgi:hypothetical protein
MPLPVTPAYLNQIAFGILTPELFNLPHQAALDILLTQAILDADAWMVLHLAQNYNLPDAPSQRLQQRGQAMLAMEYCVDVLKTLKVLGKHADYISEESPEYQALIDLNWGERAMQALDTWVTVELGGNRAFALPQLLVTDGIEPLRDQIEPMTSQYSEELDFARGISNPDIGTVRR